MAEDGISIRIQASVDPNGRRQWRRRENGEKESSDDVEESRKPGKAPVKYANEAGFGQER